MKIEFWWIGKTKEKYLTQGIEIYLRRLRYYHNINVYPIKDIKKFSGQAELMSKEGQAVIDQLNNTDYLVLLDENGRQYTSIQFSTYLQLTFLQSNYKRLIFLVAGAYGASDMLKKRANHMRSLSAMTFSHQMIRLFLVEQIYRAFTILKNEKYHNS